MSDLDLYTPAAGDGGVSSVVATVRGVDVPARLVQVGLPGGSVLWLPAQPGRYRASDGDPAAGLARVLLGPTGRPLLVLGPVDPVDPVVAATMTAAGGSTATVSWRDESYTLPYLTATYGTPPVSVWMSLSDWGVPVLVHGPSAVAPTPPPPDPGGGGGGSTVQVTQTIGPQWSGSYRHSAGAWDRWNTGRYGGRSTLYQGNGQGSGPMTGLAVYGDQLVNLGATSIDRARVALRSVGLASGSPAVTVQGTASGTQPGGAPVTGGETASGMGAWVDLPSGIREAMRTGGVKGLALVGAAYSAVAGAGNGDGMVLEITYTRPA